ncbi:hypothetical protein TONV_052 [Tipula oleracea nudivirus]|uniref:Uncharacterized protein n=1 Tax=Tipula oleracea nudivirus TaxID=1546257 RepID=A0A0B4VFT4_9VIRU|nr:hypothetical protein TONV_052 [Tipula oleracea nudivirus]AJD20112.1 hypothetical protein TONV_052 [Tipula oleracea nudivirus]
MIIVVILLTLLCCYYIVFSQDSFFNRSWYIYQLQNKYSYLTKEQILTTYKTFL